MGFFCPLVQPWNRTREQFLLNFPCLSDRVRRSSLLLKLALVALHLLFIGVLFLFDSEFIEKTKRDPWYMGSYFLLFTLTLLQYFITSGSSPGYVVDAMRDVCENNTLNGNPSTTSMYHGLFAALIYEFMPNGSFEMWLHLETVEEIHRSSKTLTLLERLNIATD